MPLSEPLSRADKLCRKQASAARSCTVRQLGVNGGKFGERSAVYQGGAPTCQSVLQMLRLQVCGDQDYEAWSPPNPEECLLGRNYTLHRRKPAAACFNAKGWEPPLNTSHPCPCQPVRLRSCHSNPIKPFFLSLSGLYLTA